MRAKKRSANGVPASTTVSPSKIKKEDFSYVTKEVDSMAWKSLKCAKSQLNLEIVLKCGQSFRWQLFRRDPKQFVGVLAGRVWVLTQNDDTLFYKTLPQVSQKFSKGN